MVAAGGGHNIESVASELSLEWEYCAAVNVMLSLFPMWLETID